MFSKFCEVSRHHFAYCEEKDLEKVSDNFRIVKNRMWGLQGSSKILSGPFEACEFRVSELVYSKFPNFW